jgi:hypothetical protein
MLPLICRESVRAPQRTTQAVQGGWLAGWLAPTHLEDLLYSAAPLTFQHAARRQRKYKDTSSPTVLIACRSIWLTRQELGSWLTSACCSKCVERRPPNWSLLHIL